MNAIAMIARCMRFSENGSGMEGVGSVTETAENADYLRSRLNEPVLPEEPMGHGHNSIDAQVGET